MTEKEVLEFARNSEGGYDSIRKKKNWKGYQVYNSWWKNHKNVIFGYPVYILVKNDTIRFATYAEAYEIITGRPMPKE